MSKRRLVILGVAMAFFLSLSLPIAKAQMRKEEAQRLADEITQMKRLKIQENQILAEEHFKGAVSLYEKGDYHKALSEFKKAEKLNPQIKKVGGYIKKTEKKIIQEEKARVAIKKKEEAKKAVLVSEAKPKKETTATLLKKGRDSYKKGDYAQAGLIFKEVLAKEPGNKAAQDWLRVSKRAEAVWKAKEERAELTQETEVALAQRKTREEAMLLDVEKAYVPQEKERGVTIEREEEKGKADIERRRIEEMKKKLSELPDVSAISFTDADVSSVLEQLMTMTGVNIFLDKRALRKAGTVSGEGEPELKVTFMTASPMPLLDLLKAVLQATGLAYKIEPSHIWISDEETISKEELITRTYQLKYGVRRTRRVELVPYEQRGTPGGGGTSGY